MVKSHTHDLSIDAEPTKELFIEMLTRDVALIPAIIDLADNCTDGARRLRDDKTWSGLSIDIKATPSAFSISDNCGGMSVEVARKYAFRFGRSSDAKSVDGEVGRFGVGMKRGLFKIGRHFHIRSTTRKNRFAVTIDVDSWAKQREWQFKFDAEPEENGKFKDDEQGTNIAVSKLHTQVQEHFRDILFVQELREQLTSKLEESIRRGLSVRVNGTTLKAHIRSFVASRELAPAKKVIHVKGQSGNSVKVELWCGLGKPESRKTARVESGWYVFCNGRMLLEADKTPATGWGVEDDASIPAYHPQFNDFRGFAYLEADDAADLPWNTTKTALDTDHQVYRKIKQEMIAIARPVINYFNKRKEQNDILKESGKEPRGPLQILFEKAATKPLSEVKARPVFVMPKTTVAIKHGPNMQRIIFEREIDKAEIVRSSLGAASWTEVGEQVFDYYYKSECNDE